MARAASPVSHVVCSTSLTANQISTRAVLLAMPAVTVLGIILKMLPSFKTPERKIRPLAAANIMLPAANPSNSCGVESEWSPWAEFPMATLRCRTNPT
jgi:hypothetical protein